ncbi:MAG: alpha/beta hydrolase [Sulfurimonas sp.]|jgi:esterase/lipase|nr:alpha/beta hydrolase [Sulfurimonas sp.]
MRRVIKSILSISFSVYFIIGLFLFIKQDNFLYFPTQKAESTYKKEIFTNEKESISTTVLNIGQNKAIIYFGGNAENVDNNINNFTEIFKDYTVYLVKYRGYGKSTGQPTEQALYSDALNIYDSIKNKYLNISVIGRSLGTGVATYLAAKRNIHKLALITPFDSMESVAQKQFPIYPMSLLLKDKYKSIDRVNKIKAKTLILMAQNDQVIKKEHTENLANKFPVSQITIEIIGNENHNSISSNKLYYTLLKKYFKNANKTQENNMNPQTNSYCSP